MRFFHGTNINFVGKRKLFFIVSTLVIVVGFSLAMILGPKLGIDFTGGTEIAVKFSGQVTTQQIRTTVGAAGFEGAEIKSFGQESQYLIRIQEAEEAPTIIKDALQNEFSGQEVTVLKVDKIGPKIGDELYGQAIMAVLLAVVAILLYIAFRFEFTYGLGAIVALVHDLIATFTIVVVVHHLGWINLELDQSILAGLLTVIGFSINDTVIIFDRIRENKERNKGMHFVKMVNMSINETLSRTINTLLTAALVLVTLVLFGGPVLQGFAFTMLIGIIIGTYSSIYIASSFVIWYLEKVSGIDFESNAGKKELAKSKS
ncbi:MAG: protein translocase subunit SecF [Candidatus Kapaibacterium sp.]